MQIEAIARQTTAVRPWRRKRPKNCGVLVQKGVNPPNYVSPPRAGEEFVRTISRQHPHERPPEIVLRLREPRANRRPAQPDGRPDTVF
jgi:hypothetical protein